MTQIPHHTDILIAGGGCAGLSLAVRLISSGEFREKSITIVDKDNKEVNDRTWCFWEKEAGFFEHLVYHRWEQLDFFAEEFHRSLSIAPYTYKMIRGKDFYAYCLAEIRKHANVKFVRAEIRNLMPGGKGIVVMNNWREEKIRTDLLFNSAIRPQPAPRDITLLQHFQGWVITTPGNVFDPSRGTLMDFRIDQHYGTSFVYVLPLSPNKALVEYTLFTPEVLKQEEYDDGLRTYLRDWLNLDQYDINEKEFGIIPMTSQRFPFIHDGYYQLGTAGGQTKGSSGYTFQFIQKHTASIVDALINGSFPGGVKRDAARFRFYDNTLLHILYNRQLEGADIFRDLFKKNDPRKVFKFLDNATSPGEELRIISTLPTWPFMKAALRQF